MKSAWFWNTEQWAHYQQAYWAGRVQPEAYKSSPLASDEDFDWERQRIYYDLAIHDTQVIDLTASDEKLWRDVRNSYHSIINGAKRGWDIEEWKSITDYWGLHSVVFGHGKPVRSAETYLRQGQWMDNGCGLLVVAHPFQSGHIVAAAYWIVYQGCAYYMSGPSIEKNVQHAVIWRSLELLKAKGIRLAELGQIDGATDKEKSIGQFKRGFGGYAVPFTVARRRA